MFYLSPQNQSIKSISGPMNYWQPTVEDKPDERDSEAALMSTSPQSYYACPRSFFNAPVAEPHKVHIYTQSFFNINTNI